MSLSPLNMLDSYPIARRELRRLVRFLRRPLSLLVIALLWLSPFAFIVYVGAAGDGRVKATLENRVNRTLAAAYGIPLDVPRELVGVPLRDGSVELRVRYSKGHALEAVVTVEQLDEEGSLYSVGILWVNDGRWSSRSVFYVDDSKSPPGVRLRDATFLFRNGERGASLHSEQGFAEELIDSRFGNRCSDRVSIIYEGVDLPSEAAYFSLSSPNETLVYQLPRLARDVMISRLLLEGHEGPTPHFAARAVTSLSTEGLGRMVLAIDWSMFAFSCILILYPPLVCTWTFGIVRRVQKLDASALLRLAYGPGRLARELVATRAIVSLVLATVVLSPLALGSVMVAAVCDGLPSNGDLAHWLTNNPAPFSVALSSQWLGVGEMLLSQSALLIGMGVGATTNTALLWRRPRLGGACAVAATMCGGVIAITVVFSAASGMLGLPTSLGFSLAAVYIAWMAVLGCREESRHFTHKLSKLQVAESEQWAFRHSTCLIPTPSRGASCGGLRGSCVIQPA